jgi:hypothetical protein
MARTVYFATNRVVRGSPTDYKAYDETLVPAKAAARSVQNEAGRTAAGESVWGQAVS